MALPGRPKKGICMQSIRSHLIIWLLRNRHLLKLKLRPEVVDENFSVTDFRAGIERATAALKLPKGVTTQAVTVDGLNAEWITPATAADTDSDAEKADNKVLLYIHGGGFISGSCQTHRNHVAKFASGSGLQSLLFDYRLAPEHPYPAAIEDCITAYLGLLKLGYQPENIVIGGESAGGTLTLALLLALKQQRQPLPAAAFAISPVTDLRCLASTFRTNASRDIAPMGSWDIWTRYYIADSDPTGPLLSPQFGDLSGLPPLHICVGSHEIHLDDCQAFADKARAAGVETTLAVWPRMIHAFPILAPLFPEAKQALSEICAFARQAVTKQPQPSQ